MLQGCLKDVILRYTWHHVNVSAPEHELSYGKPASVNGMSLSQLGDIVKVWG